MKSRTYSIEFNHCRLGILFGEPAFITQPEAEAVDGRLRFDNERKVAIRVRLGIIDDGFGRMLDPAGKLCYLLPQCFLTVGELRFDDLNCAGIVHYRVKLPEAGCYIDDPIHGRMLQLEFPLENPSDVELPD